MSVFSRESLVLLSVVLCGALVNGQAWAAPPKGCEKSAVEKRPVTVKKCTKPESPAKIKSDKVVAPKASSKKTAVKQATKLPVKQAGTRAAKHELAQKAVPEKKRRSSIVKERDVGVASSLALQSNFALVLDQKSGEALYQKNADTVVPIASITKLMTAMVLLDGAPDLHAPVSISDEDVDYLRGSRSRLSVGAVLSRETALLLALMSSENRAAHALARHYPSGLPSFVQAMNAKAKSLGMKDTHFEDPTGLTKNNVSTARDLSKMVAAAQRYPLIREFTTTAEATVDVAGRPTVYRNTNPLVKSASWEVGLSKTGYIQEAGKCLVMQARFAEKPVVIVLLDSAGKETRVGDANRVRRWIEATNGTRRNEARADYATSVVKRTT